MKPSIIFPQYSQPQIISQHDTRFFTWLEIDKAALEHNLQSYKSIVAPALFAPVIKSNAYGHGIELVAKICDTNASVDMICLVSLTEAIYLRSLGIQKPLLVLSILDNDWHAIASQSIDVVVYDLATALELNKIGKEHKTKINIHIKVDTGLSRLGVLTNDALEFITTVHALPFITIKGMFTHFADSENSNQSFTNHQIEQLRSIIVQLEKLDIFIPLKHSSCSAAITSNANSHFTLSRAGIGIYGLWPSKNNKILTQQAFPQFNLKSVLTWKTKIMHIKEVPAGSYVGYDRTHRTDKSTLIATLPLGYWDGYDRGLSNKGLVVIHGKQAPILGRIAMNLCMVDVTSIKPSIGDEVILMGNYPGITADEFAAHCNSINYEVVTRINPLLPRMII